MSNASTLENNINMSVCANCGKGEDDGTILKACAACKLVKYCSRDCQIAHRPQHKKQCKRRAKELHEIELFKQPPPMEDCPICMERLPTLCTGRTFMPCCGKVLCNGCIHAFQLGITREKDNICPFCRTPASKSDEENIKRFEKRAAINDARAIHNLGCHYRKAKLGLPQDHVKALELWHRAGELGSAGAYYNIGCAYQSGNRGVERDMEKATHYWESGAMLGHTGARYNLGVHHENNLGDLNKASKHYMIAVNDGCLDSLNRIKEFYRKGYATKDEYAKALRGYQSYLDEIKTNQRDEAVAVWDDYKYYDSV